MSNNRPPVDIEQWMDLVVAANASRSQNEGQRKFGEKIIERYFVDLRGNYANDPVAQQFLDNMLCAVASAIRGFSVARDEFSTEWKALENKKNLQIEGAKLIDRFAPFAENGYFKQAITIVGALGISSPIVAGFQQSIGNLPWILIVSVAGAFAIGLFIIQGLIDSKRNQQMIQIEEDFPDSLRYEWETETLNKYRDILKQFLLSAIRIRYEYYPNLTTISYTELDSATTTPSKTGKTVCVKKIKLDELNKYIDLIVEQHFAFKAKKPKLKHGQKKKH